MYIRTCAPSKDSDQPAQLLYLLGVFRLAKDAKFLHADNKDSDHIVRMRRLIGIFVGRTCQNFADCYHRF